MFGQVKESKQARGDAYRYVHIKYPAPRQLVYQKTAKYRPHGGCNHGRDNEDTRNCDTPFRRKCPIEDSGTYRSECAAGSSLQNPKYNEHREVLRQATEGRRYAEESQREQKNTLCAETIPQPAGGWNNHSETD